MSSEMQMTGVGNAVRVMRREAGMSVRNVAAALDMNHGTYSKYETGARPISLAFVERFADAVGIKREVAVLRCIKEAYPVFSDVPDIASLFESVLSVVEKAKISRRRF